MDLAAEQQKPFNISYSLSLSLSQIGSQPVEARFAGFKIERLSGPKPLP